MRENGSDPRGADSPAASGRRRGLVIGAAAGLAALLVLGVVGAYFYLRPAEVVPDETASALDLDDTPLHRPSPLPYYVHDGATWHEKLIGLPEGDLDLKFLDALIPGGELPLALTREYRSNQKDAGVFGPGWASNLDMRLKPAARTLAIHEADGRTSVYGERDGLFLPLLPTALANIVVKAGDGWERRWQSGKREDFDNAGRLLQIAFGDRRVRFHYPDALEPHPDAITDASGHALHLAYTGGHLTSVDVPQNRTLRYDYQDGRLVRTTDALGRAVSFVYENGRVARLLLPDGGVVAIGYAADGRVAGLAGPGAPRTAFAWRKIAGGAELRAVLADGESETTRFEARVFHAAEWGDGTAALAGADGTTGLAITRIDTAGIATRLFQLGDKLLFRQDGTGGSAGIDPASGTIHRFGGDRAGYALTGTEARDAIATMPPDVLWHARLAPGVVGTAMAGSRYDAAGRAVEIRAANTDERWAWDDADRITDWISTGGVHTHYEYDAMDRVTRISVDGVPTLSAEYDAAGQLASVTHADGGVTRYGYDAEGRCIAVLRPDGTAISYLRDRFGRIVAIARNGLPIEQLAYDRAGRIVRQGPPDGPASTFAYDALGRVVREEDGLGQTTSYSYDPQGRVSESAESGGTRTSYSYAGSVATSVTTFADGRTTTQAIDAAHHTIALKGRDGRTVTLHYGESGAPDIVSDSVDGETKYQYDGAARLSAIAYPGGVTRNFTYDAQGRLASVVTGDHTLTIAYAPEGITLHDKTPSGERVSSYDARGALLARTDEAGHTKRYVYDSAGRLSSVTAADGRTLTYQYDAAGRITQLSAGQGGAQASLSVSYDAAGRPLGVAHEDGTREQFAYDAAGRVVQKTNRQGQTLAYSYDTGGRVLGIAGPSGTLANRYDAQGRLIERDDPVEGVTRFEYGPGRLDTLDVTGARTSYAFDPAGRLTSITDALGGKTQESYDAQGRMTALVDANGNRAGWIYGADGLSADYTSPLGKVAHAAFDAQGRLVTQAYPGNRAISLAYNESGEISRLASDGKSWSYAYDANGLAAISGPEGTSRYHYDGDGRVVSFTSPAGAAIAYAYDTGGRLVSMKSPRLGLVRYRYDALGRLAGIATGAGETVYAYDAAGRPATVAYPNKTILTYAYDAGLRVASITLTDAHGAALYAERYGYDSRGNVVTVTDPDGATSYSYDALNRVTDVARPDGTHETFAYDSLGNIVRHDNEASAFDADGARIARGDATVVPDPAGRDCGDTRAGGVQQGKCTLAFDTLGRVTSAGLHAYQWDGTGHLVGITGPDIAERFLYAGNTVVEDADAKAKVERDYAPGAFSGEWSSVSVNGKRLYPVWSANGTLRLLTDEHGKVVARYHAALYGLAKVDGDASVPFVFAGGTFDKALQAVRLGPRVLGRDGRFLSQDPAGPDKDGNRYSYALDNPLRFKDSAGTSSTMVTHSWTETYDLGRGVTANRNVSITIPEPTPLSELPKPAIQALPENLAPLPGSNLQRTSYAPWNGDVAQSRAVLEDIARHDPNPVVRAAAEDTLQTIAVRNPTVAVEPVKMRNGVPDPLTGGEAHLGSNQVTMFEQGVNSNLAANEVPAVRSAGVLSHEVEHASVQDPHAVAPYGTQQEWEAFYKQEKIQGWSAEGTPTGIVNQEGLSEGRSVAANIMTNESYEPARAGDRYLQSTDPSFRPFQNQMYQDLGNDVRRGRQITMAGQETTVTKGANYTINTTEYTYDAKNGQLVQAAPSGERLSVNDQVDRLRQMRAQGASPQAASTAAQSEAASAESAARVGNKTAEMPAVNFENGGGASASGETASGVGNKTAELPAVNFENGGTSGAKPNAGPTAAGGEAAEANQTRQLTEVGFDKPGINSGEINGGNVANGARNVEGDVAKDVASAGRGGANAGGGSQSVILECENGECYKMSKQGFERVNPDGTPYVEPGSTPAIDPKAPTAELPAGQGNTAKGGNAAAEGAGNAEGTILECTNGECYRMSESKGMQRVNPDGTPYTGPENVNPKGSTAEISAVEGGEASAASESRVARAELDTVVGNARTPIASETEAVANGTLGSVESAVAREAGGAELAAVERTAAGVVAEEAVAGVEQQAFGAAAREAAATLAGSAWKTVMEGAPAQFVKELLLPMAAEALEAANPVFMALMAKDIAIGTAKVLGWAGRQIGNIIANPLEEAFKQLNAPEQPQSEEELARQRMRRRAAQDAMIQPSPQAVTLWSPPEQPNAPAAQNSASETSGAAPNAANGNAGAPPPSGPTPSTPATNPNGGTPANNTGGKNNGGSNTGTNAKGGSNTGANNSGANKPPNAPLGESPANAPSANNTAPPANGNGAKPATNAPSAATTPPSPGNPSANGSASNTPSAPNGTQVNIAPAAGSNPGAGNSSSSAPRASPQPLPPSPFGPATAQPSASGTALSAKPGTPPVEAGPHAPPPNQIAQNTPRGPPTAPPRGPGVGPARTPYNSGDDQGADTTPPAAPPSPSGDNPTSSGQSSSDCSGITGQLNCKVLDPMLTNGSGTPPAPGTVPQPPGTTPGANTGAGPTAPNGNGTTPTPATPTPTSPGNGGTPTTPTSPTTPPTTPTTDNGGGGTPPTTPSTTPTDTGGDGLPPPPAPPPTAPSSGGNGTTPTSGTDNPPTTPPTTPPTQPPPTQPPPTQPPPTQPPEQSHPWPPGGWQQPAYDPSAPNPLAPPKEPTGPIDAYHQGGLAGAYHWAANALDNWVTKKLLGG